MKTAKSKCAVLVATIGVTLGGPAGANGLPANSETPVAAPVWSFTFRPYAWVTWLDGDLTVRGRRVDVDITPEEVIENLQMAWFSYVEARVGRIAIFNDIAYANLGASRDLARVRDNAGVEISAGLDVKQATIEFGGAYQVALWPSPARFRDAASTGATALEVLGGVRYWYQEADLSLALTANLDLADLEVRDERAFARSGSVDWIDPFIGLRLRYDWAPGRALMLRGDVGGFGAGSDFSWQLMGALNFDVAVRNGIAYSGVLGYRALSVDYEQGSGRREYRYDVLQHGPLVGLQLRF